MRKTVFLFSNKNADKVAPGRTAQVLCGCRFVFMLALCCFVTVRINSFLFPDSTGTCDSSVPLVLFSPLFPIHVPYKFPHVSPDYVLKIFGNPTSLNTLLFQRLFILSRICRLPRHAGSHCKPGLFSQKLRIWKKKVHTPVSVLTGRYKALGYSVTKEYVKQPMCITQNCLA